MADRLASEEDHAALLVLHESASRLTQREPGQPDIAHAAAEVNTQRDDQRPAERRKDDKQPTNDGKDEHRRKRNPDELRTREALTRSSRVQRGQHASHQAYAVARPRAAALDEEPME